MKHKFSSMGRVAIALVLALSLSLVMAVPVAAIDTGFSVVNDPQTVGRPAEYTIIFTTDFPLFSGVGTITITFPDDTTVPASDADIAKEKVTVNGTECAVNATVVTADREVTITVPKDIPADVVEVVIAVDSGIENPTSVLDTWTLDVQTSAEPVDVTSAAYSTIAVVPPEIIEVVGTAYQNSNDTIVITFSELVDPVGNWTAAFPTLTSILCGTTGLALVEGDFSPTVGEVGVDGTLTLTITLDFDTRDAYLVSGQTLSVTPEASQLANVAGDAHVAKVEVTGSISGDSVTPAVALEYSLDRPVKDTDDPTITATFSEDMAASPTITIVDAGSVTLVAAEDMIIVGADPKVWDYGFDVPTGSDGIATVTISGTDLAGNANQTATNNTFVIDNTAPTIAVTDIVGTTISGAGDTIEITFSEAVTATWAAAVFNKIESVVDETPTTLTLSGNTGFAYDADTLTLTITLDEATDGEYLVNGETLTVTPEADAILDDALNPMAITAVVGTVLVTGDLDVPTITGIVGVGTTGIKIVFSELAVAADGSWSANEFSIESPAGAPLNINNAAITDPAKAKTVLTITLDADAPDFASLDAGEIICVTPTADAVVDLAGNPLAAVEVNSGGEAGWLEVLVDDDADADWLDDPTHFDNITLAIAAVAEGGTVSVLPGTYSYALTGETFPIDVDVASLTLESVSGAASTKIEGGTTRGLIKVTADNVTIGGTDKGFAIENDFQVSVTGYDIDYGILVGGDVSAVGVKIQDNTFEIEGNGIVLGPRASSTSGNKAEILDNTFVVGWDAVRTTGMWGEFLNLVEYIDITGNTVTIHANPPQYGSMGFVLESAQHVLFDDNTITGGDAAVYLTANYTGITTLTATDITITNNTFTNCPRGIQIYPGTNEIGGPCTIDDVTISYNTFSGAKGVRMLQGASDGYISNIAINYNDFSGSTTYGVDNTLTSVDAENNWWGTAVESEIEGMVTTAYVDYTPWLDGPYPYGEPTTTDVTAYVIDLVAGWNLISLPLIPTYPNIDTAMADLIDADAVISVRTFKWEADVIGEEWWKPDVAASDLDQVVDGQGYWIEMSAADALVVTGSEGPDAGGMQPSYELHAGWNLIGFKSVNPNIAVVDYLGPAIAGSWNDDILVAAGTVQAMYSYNAADEVYELVLIPKANGEATVLVPGQGYWVALSESGTIYP